MPETKTPLRGFDLARDVINHILDHPETWNQADWHCGTTHCFGGHVQIRGGKPESASGQVIRDVQELLGISPNDAEWLCAGNRTLLQLHGFVAAMREGGFDRAGFNRGGFNRDGFDRAGFDRDGFDRAGFDRDGFDRAGFNWAGFDRAGFDRAGFDRAGFNRDGFDRAGKRLPKIEAKEG